MPKWGKAPQIGIKDGQKECENAIETIEKSFIN
jgi:hypothetical protein